MPEKSVRFGISDGNANRAATWKCWTNLGRGKNDVYLTCRSLGGALKASLHESGSWHVAYNQDFYNKNVSESDRKLKNRFIDIWPRPNELSPGLKLAYRIVTPSAGVNVPITQSIGNNITWVPNASEGKATEIDIFIASKNAVVSNWPGKRSMGTNLIDSFVLESGEVVWLIYWEVPMPKLPDLKGTPKYYIGRSKEDLINKNIRVIVYGTEPDGSRVMYDCALQFKENTTNKAI